SELRRFHRRLSEFATRGIRIVAISVDSPAINRHHHEKLGLTFPLLSDPKAEVIRRYDLLHSAAGPKGTDLARPTEFLIDSTGSIRWVSVTESAPVLA